MAEFISDLSVDFRTLRLPPANDFGAHQYAGNAGSYNSDDFPGLFGEYSYGSVAALWTYGSLDISDDMLVFFGQSSLSVDGNGYPQSGTITGLGFQDATDPYAVFLLAGISISAATLRNAAQTSSQTDDRLAYAQMLSGNDRIELNGGRNWVSGYAGNDVVACGSGPSTLHGGAGDDTLNGSYGNDVLVGGAGDDVLSAGYGANRLNGGSGSDTLSGGEGTMRDVFVFTSAADSRPGWRRDIIEDFDTAADDIHLRGIDANTSVEGNQTFTFNGTTARAHSVWYTSTSTYGIIVVRADTNGDRIADFAVKLEEVTEITADDFIL